MNIALPSVDAALETPGQPLSSDTREFMEDRLGHDFRSVRIHTDASAAASARDINARAYTVDKDVVFAQGAYETGSIAGVGLLAHELAHVVQQGAASVVRRDIGTTPQTTDPNREQIEKALKSRDSDDVDLISSLALAKASHLERFDLIEIVLDQTWVGPTDEENLERIWESFGPDLPGIASAHFPKWTECVERGADLDELRLVKAIKAKFENDVTEKAKEYLLINLRFIAAETARMGLNVSPSKRSVAQSDAIQGVQEDAKQVKRSREALAKLREIQVGYDWLEYNASAEDVKTTLESGYFNPDKRPDSAPRGTEVPPLASWESVKKQHDAVTAVINGLVNKSPAIFALVQEDKVEGAAAATPDQARGLVSNAFQAVSKNIAETWPKIDSGDLDFRDLKPIHEQLKTGQPGKSRVPWNIAFNKWVAEDVIGDYESEEFWISLGLGSLAAAAFIVAELATLGSATFFLAAGVGIGATAVQAGKSWEQYLDLAQAAKTNVDPTLALVSQGQASSALIQAVLDTAFAFLDLYGPASRGIKALTAAEKAAARKALEKGEREVLERAGTETAQVAERGVEKKFKEFAGICELGSIICHAELPEHIVAEAGPHPDNYGILVPKGPFSVQKAELFAVRRATRHLQNLAKSNRKAWPHFDQALAAAEEKGLKWPVDSAGNAWEVHHIKPVGMGGGNDLANLVPLPSLIHSEYTTWWNNVRFAFKRRFTTAEWDAIYRSERDVLGSEVP